MRSESAGRVASGLRQAPDLTTAIVFVLVAAAALVVEAPVVVRVLLGIPLVFLLPGYALVGAGLPTVRLQPFERLILSVAVSISVAALVGLLIGFSGLGLSQATWALSLCGITLIGLLVARARRPQTSAGASRSVGQLVPARQMVALVLGVVVAVAIIGATRMVTADQETPAPAQLWMMAGPTPGSVRVGLRGGADPATYRVRLTSGGNLIEEVEVSLATGEAWQTVIEVEDEHLQRPIVARLFESGGEAEIRFVVLQPDTDGN